jgi:hypothetical protein
MQMESPDESSGHGHGAPASSKAEDTRQGSADGERTFWHRFDAKYMKPYFGGNLDVRRYPSAIDFSLLKLVNISCMMIES